MKKKYIIIVLSIIVVTLLVFCGNFFTIENVFVVFANNTDKNNEYEILKAANISDRTIIFNLRESDIKQNVAKHYKDNTIYVTNIERKFPNNITIYVKERISIFKISVFSQSNVERFVPADKDFQIGTIIDEEYQKYLIEVEDFVVMDTFDLKECNQLRDLANALIDEGIKEEALPYFILSVKFVDEFIKIDLRNSNATIFVRQDSIINDIKVLYHDYLALDEQSRFSCQLKVG